MANHLSAEQRERFLRDGFLFPVRALEAREAADYLARLEAIESKGAGRLSPLYNAKPHLLIPWLWDLVRDPRILDCVEDMLGPDILCWGTSFISKSAADARYVAWHQDATYWGLEVPEAVTAWVALTPSLPDNGCVRAIPRSHLGAFPHTDSGDRANLLGRGEKMVADVDESEAVDFVLSPGEMSLHHCLAVHGSARNISSVRRVGFAIRYISSRNGQKGKARNTATLVRGRNLGRFELEIGPERDFDPAAVARHPEIVRRGMNIIFEGAPQRLHRRPARGE